MIYRFFDLAIESEMELPWLAQADASVAEWTVGPGRVGEGFEFVHAWQAPGGAEVMRAGRRGADYLLEFPGLARFELAFGERRIVAEAAAGCSDTSLAHLLLDQALPRAVCHLGRCVIHASAVEIGGGAVAFTGETGMGKSTLAAAFQRAGYRVLADDCLLFEPAGKGAQVLAAYPSLRLWPDSADALYAGAEQARLDTGEMAHYSSKRVLGAVAPVEARALPLAALCLLQPGAPGTGPREGTTLQAVGGVAAVMALVGAQFTLDPVAHGAVVRAFEAVRRVAGRAPVFSLAFPRDFSALPEVIDKVAKSCVSGGAGRPPNLLEDRDVRL